MFIPKETNLLNDGIQKLYKFTNGYGASVIKNPYSYGGAKGLWELAVIKWENDQFNLCYDTPITQDAFVLGYLEESEIESILEKINALR